MEVQGGDWRWVEVRGDEWRLGARVDAVALLLRPRPVRLAWPPPNHMKVETGRADADRLDGAGCGWGRGVAGTACGAWTRPRGWRDRERLGTTETECRKSVKICLGDSGGPMGRGGSKSGLLNSLCKDPSRRSSDTRVRGGSKSALLSTVPRGVISVSEMHPHVR